MKVFCVVTEANLANAEDKKSSSAILPYLPHIIRCDFFLVLFARCLGRWRARWRMDLLETWSLGVLSCTQRLGNLAFALTVLAALSLPLVDFLPVLPGAAWRMVKSGCRGDVVNMYGFEEIFRTNEKDSICGYVRES